MTAPLPQSNDRLAHLHDRWDREQAFHDNLAERMNPAEMPAAEPSRYDAAVLTEANVKPGTRVLDLGCGQGDLTLALLQRGAVVTSLDLSPGMVEVTRRRVALHSPESPATFIAAPVEATGLPSQAFDVIVGRWILHHIDLDPAAAELARLLAPGGRAVFLENSGANPILNVARNHLIGRCGIPRLGTEDERPLVADDWRVLERDFSTVRGEFPVVDVLELFDRQVVRYRFSLVSAACRWADRAIARTRLRRYSYRVLVVAVK